MAAISSREEARLGDEPPLVVDLDGSLIGGDMLHESANQFIARSPLGILRLLGWAADGKAALKARLAAGYRDAPDALHYHRPLLDWLCAERQAGRRLILATASDRRLAESVAAHLGIFDEVLASDGSVNLKAERKRDLLVSRFGVQGYDYVGNDHADLPVWAQARRAHIVGGSRTLRAKVEEIATVDRCFDRPASARAKSLLRALRPHQWIKNLLLLVPLFAAHRYTDPASVMQAMVALFVFSLTASGIYILNDLVDVDADRRHASKRRRPFAAGELSLLHGWMVWPVCVGLAFAIAAATLPMRFVAELAAYVGVTAAYSFVLKRIAIIDAITLAGLYTLRIIAGAAAIEVPLSFWLLSFSIFIFLSLAFIKRYSELRAARDAERTDPLPGRGYRPDDLELISSLGSGAGYISVLVLALYIQDGSAQLYHAPKLIWLACPLLLYWISRAWLVAHRGEMHHDPIVFALKDRASWLTGIALLATFVLARFV